MVFLEGAYLRGESRQTYEGLLNSLGSSELLPACRLLKTLNLNKLFRISKKRARILGLFLI